MRPAIEVMEISKRFGKVPALRGVSFEAREGSVLGLLGHNGAGKSTLVNILATLSRPNGGAARVAGLDVVRQAGQVRQRIGLAGQFAALDEQITGAENLILIGRLLGATQEVARSRSDELLQLFELTDVGRRPVRTYSGGMRRRLDLAASLVGRPEVIFLDEPTVGLDPSSRMNMWNVVKSVTGEGATVLLTTQYLEEADRLADSIVVLSGGKVVASGSPAELKARVGDRTLTARYSHIPDAHHTLLTLRSAGLEAVWDAKKSTITASVARAGDIVTFVRAMGGQDAEIEELTFAEPNLDDVFHAFTGDGNGRGQSWQE
ncbi:ATP-binding cassette domain-containing protein [Streptosporangium sp. NPDC051022]|uniref:ATP-binding cassette domain-containing protein n=1 Tax=Streptosporangium sp. NPDC051022 TaxID=3155752 RepID=UPI0034179CEA